jgi:hypothetical protein
LILPNWDDVASREYHAWSVPKITIDTAGLKPSESYARLCELLKQQL